MTTLVTKYAAKHIMSKTFDKYGKEAYGGEYDPLFHEVEDPHHPGRKRKVKKLIPEYIPEHDALVLARVRKLAYSMDMSLFRFMGTRVGWSGLIGLVPVAGDVVDGVIALYLVNKCRKVSSGLPNVVLLYMLLNVAVDIGIGLVPIVGDLADAHFKCNSRNVRLLEKQLDKMYKAAAPAAEDDPTLSLKHASPSGLRHRPEPKPPVCTDTRTSRIIPPASVMDDSSDEPHPL